jgi:hypothetical protein
MNQPPKIAFGMGYIIADDDGRIQFNTLACNRADCWRLFLPYQYNGSKAELKKVRDKYKAQGFRCVFVIVEQSQ